MLLLGVISYLLEGFGIISLIITRSKVLPISITKEIEWLAGFLVFDLVLISQNILGFWIFILIGYFVRSVFEERFKQPSPHYTLFLRLLFCWGMIGMELLMMFGNFTQTTQFQSALFVENVQWILVIFGAILIFFNLGGLLFILFNLRFSHKSAIELVKNWALSLGIFLLTGSIAYGIIRGTELIGITYILLATIVYGIQAGFMVLSIFMAWKTPRIVKISQHISNSREPSLHTDSEANSSGSDAQLKEDELTELAPEAKNRYRGFSYQSKSSVPPTIEAFKIPSNCPKCQGGLDNNGFCVKCEMLICPRCYNLNKKGSINCTCGYYLGKH